MDLELFQVSILSLPKKLKLIFIKLLKTKFNLLFKILNFLTFNFFEELSLI